MKACLIIVCCFCANLCSGQGFSFFGYGRAVSANERLAGSILDGDTVNTRQNSGGYTLFDMGITFQPYHHFKGTAIVRVRNESGIFWGEGVSLSVRQLRFEGVAANVLHYEVGDLDVKMSPFTLQVPEMFPENALPDIFQIRRDIQEYENFTLQHRRRLQGVSVFSLLHSQDKAHHVGIKTIAVRNPPDLIPGENRLMLAGVLDYRWKEKTQLRANLINHFQLPDTSAAPEVNNHIGSLEYKHNLGAFNTIKLSFEGESGFSTHKTVFIVDSSISKQGYFSKNALVADLKQGLKMQVGYSRVSADFYSPSAQTTLFSYYQPLSVLPYYGNNYFQRKPSLFDFNTQENLYNRNIRTNLWPYFPIYDNIFPYGEATPNRQGIFLHANYQNKKQLVKAYLELFNGGETAASIGTTKRKFQQYRLATDLNLGQFYGWNKNMRLTWSIRQQTTSALAGEYRNEIDLRSTLITAGLDMELVKQFYFLLAYQGIRYRGNEFMPLRDIQNGIYDYQYVDVDGKETLLSAGAKYHVASSSFFTLQVVFSTNKDHLILEDTLTIRQFYLNFTVAF